MYYILHDEINSNDVKILRREKPAGGRSDALDHGAEIANGEFVMILDSDLKILAEPLDDMCVVVPNSSCQ